MAFTTNYYVILINHCPFFIFFIFGGAVKQVAVEDFELHEWMNK